MIINPSELDAISKFLELKSDSWRATALYGPQKYEAHASIYPLDAVESLESEIGVLRDLVAILSNYTSTPTEWFICYWDGWGIDLEAPSIQGTARRHFVVSTSIKDPTGWPAPGSAAAGIPPSYIWPRDRAWVLAKDIDVDFVGLAATTKAIEGMTREPAFEITPWKEA